MRWLKRDRWKASIAIAGMLLLLVLIVWVPVSAADAQEGALGLAAPVTGTAQATPTEDATVSALNKEKLVQEVQQLKSQNETDFLSWLRTNAATFLSTTILVIGGLIGLFRWFGDRRDEREKRAEERFQSVVTGLGDEKEGAKIGAAILLRTFLRPGYEQFYSQTFDLAVAHLRLPRTPHPPEDPNAAQPLTALSQVLAVVFKEAFPRARSLEKSSPDTNSHSNWHAQWYMSLDAGGIILDNTNLGGADLKQVWMQGASLRKVNFARADLRGAYLSSADLSEAFLSGPAEDDLIGADLREADLSGANLHNADFSGADLRETYLHNADFSGADLTGANLRGANLHGNDLQTANLEDALSLKDTDLRGVKGLTKEQLETCKAKGAIIDEAPTTSPPQSTVSPSPPLQSHDAQAPSAPSAQVNTPTPETNGSSATSSKPTLEW